MKKSILLSGLICFSCSVSFAQTAIEFIPTGGYTFDYKKEFSGVTGRLNGGFNYGASLKFNFSQRFGIDLMYNRMQVPAKLYSANAVPGDQPLYQTSAGINYIMAGFLFSFPLKESPVSLFLGPEMGVAVFTPSPNSFESNVHFAMGFQAGADIYLDPHFGIRLSGRILGTAKNSSEFYFGEWGGEGGFFEIFSPGIVQGGFNIGFIIGLGQVLPEPQQKAKTPRRHRRPPVNHDPAN